MDKIVTVLARYLHARHMITINDQLKERENL